MVAIFSSDIIYVVTCLVDNNKNTHLNGNRFANYFMTQRYEVIVK